jgi:pyruvate carboxylase
VFKGYKEHQAIYGDTYMLPTRLFLAPLPLGKEVEVDVAPGKLPWSHVGVLGLDVDGHQSTPLRGSR